MKNFNQLKIGAFLSYISLGIGNVVSILYTPIMLRLLGQSEYGLYSLSNSIIGYLGALDFGMGNAVVRYTAKYRALDDKEGEYNLYGMFIIIYSILAIIVILSGGILVNNIDIFFSATLNNKELNRIKIIVCVMIFNLAISFPLGIFGSIIHAYEHFIFPKLIEIIRAILNPFIMLPLLFMGYKSLGMTVASTCLNLICIIVNIYYCIKFLKIKIKFNNMNFAVIKEILVYSFFIFVTIIADKIYWSTDQLILGSLLGSISVAVFAIAATINRYYMSFSTAISSVFLPKVVKMISSETNEDEISNLFIKTGRLQFLIIAFIFSGFCLVGKNFIEIWAGTNYIEAYFIAIIIMLPFTIDLIQNIGISIMQAKNKNKFRAILMFILAVINICFTIPLAKLYGGIGCAISTAVSLLIGNIILNIYYYQQLKINIFLFWKEILKLSLPIILCSTICFILKLCFNLSGIIELLIIGTLFTILYCLMVWLFGMNESEKSLFLKPFLMLKNNQ